MSKLRFATFTSDIELPFYTSLASHKINHDKLDDSARRLLGVYEIRPQDNPESSNRIQLHGNALTADEVPAGCYRAEGYIKNVNTIEDYRSLDKMAILERAGRTIWDAIKDGTVYSCPSLLTSIVMICFADLKKYKFTYLVGFPALHSDASWTIAPPPTADEGEHVYPDRSRATLTSDETTSLVECVQTWRYSVDARQYGFFLVKKLRKYTKRASGDYGNSSTYRDEATESHRSTPPISPGLSMDFSWKVDSLSKYDEGFFDGTHRHDRFICFADPSTYQEYPGWMLRNLLVLVRKRWHLQRIQILCYRDTQSRRHEAKSTILHLELDHPTIGATAVSTDSEMPKITGWERNATGKVTSKIANLGEYMDPQRLADQAVDLNLKLIKWRISPSLNLDIIKETKCLLLGAGTLGSYVARNLLGWGVRKVTFVDNGSVSFSNPVRQPLYDFKDCLNGGSKKAYRAAEALAEVYPGVDSTGHVFSIPMAGHPIIDEAKVKEDFHLLQRLIEEHDIIFLLMDTRESRWLPTVMAKAAGKIVMNAALGFDTFVVMRHGLEDQQHPEKELGCYFCNDVVAPADSLTDRTLDQQCTVTRPGVAAIASALLVEIMVSILQHKDGGHAQAPLSATEDSGTHPLGIVPHQIRGFLSTFQNMIISGKSYDCCSACSPKVTGEYKRNGWFFVKKALNDKGYVEKLSGLAEVQRAAEAAAANVEWDDDDQADGNDDGDGELI